MTPRMLIAGIGNIFLGDDGFGVEVAQTLQRRPQRPGVEVADFGIRGIDLIYALQDGPDAVILIDAVPRGAPPGTLYVIEPQIDPDAPVAASIEAHSLDPLKVLQAAASMGPLPRHIRLVGCQPSGPPGGDEAMAMGLSDPVRAAVDEAVGMVESLVRQLERELKSSFSQADPAPEPAGPQQEIRLCTH